MMYKQDPQVCNKLQYSMASNQLTGFESLSMDVITSSGLCACFFLMRHNVEQKSNTSPHGGTGEIAQPYGSRIHLSNANLECANYCKLYLLYNWHKHVT